MADAVTSLFPGTKVSIGPCIDNGFYYDFDSKHTFTPDDLEKIEKKIEEIIKAKLPFEEVEITKDEALEMFRDKKEKYKVEIIESLPDDEKITLYKHGDFVDLCKGPHVEKTSDIKAVKLLSIAGSYWRGDENRDKLQRIYGTAFSNKKELRKYLDQLAEAKKRDHRVLGKQLGLFNFHPEAPASPFFYPKGALIYRLLTDYLRDLYVDHGYDEVITPEVLDMSLWEKSGHLSHFQDNMYFTEVENRQMAVKPMNCPGHCLMFGERKWSYRELPVRFADFGRLHRFERSGVTHGLTRVRTFCQDDAHIFCTPDQMGSEIQNFIKLIKEVYERFEFSEILVALATKPENALGSKELWDKAETILENELKNANVDYHINEGEGAFYGPKIEFQVKDALGRAWQLGTLQVDYSMPNRFELAYIDSDGEAKQPVMLHRAVLGSIERFMGILIEHCGGAFPFWMAPTQIKLIPITDSELDLAKKYANQLKCLGYRAEIDSRNEKLGLKIREAQVEKIPFMGIIGKKEAENESLSLRERKQGDLGVLKLPELIDKFKQL
jgi:threonyl-tRNA synthetase